MRCLADCTYDEDVTSILNNLIEICEMMFARSMGLVEVGREMTKGIEHRHVWDRMGTDSR
jgi:hypothetical protein